MSMSLVIVLLVLVAAVVFFFLRRPKPPAGNGQAQTRTQTAAGHEQRIHGNRRSGHDKREEIRFDPEKTPRRTGSGRRAEDKLWDKEN
jgi:hypothetical protein